MDEQKLFEYLRQNLSIQVDTRTEFGPVETLVVRLNLTDPNGNNVEISESYTSLPIRDGYQ